MQDIQLKTFENDTYIYIKEYTGIEYVAKYMVQNDYSEALVKQTDLQEAKIEMNSSIVQTAEEINLEVSKKVGKDEIISQINQTAEKIAIKADKIDLNGSITANGNFKIDTEGNMQCKDATMKDSYMDNITIKSMAAQDNSFYFQSNGKVYAKALELEGEGNSDTILVCGNKADNSEAFMTSRLIALRTDYSSPSNVTISNSGETGHIYVKGAIESRGSGAGITTDGSMFATNFVNSSKEILKENIRKLEENSKKKSLLRTGIDIIKNADICEYNFKGQEHKQIGVVIGDNYNTPEEILSEDKKGVDLYSMISVLWRAVQEQQEEIDALKERMDKYEKNKKSDKEVN